MPSLWDILTIKKCRLFESNYLVQVNGHRSRFTDLHLCARTAFGGVTRSIEIDETVSFNLIVARRNVGEIEAITGSFDRFDGRNRPNRVQFEGNIPIFELTVLGANTVCTDRELARNSACCWVGFGIILFASTQQDQSDKRNKTQ